MIRLPPPNQVQLLWLAVTSMVLAIPTVLVLVRTVILALMAVRDPTT